MSAYWIRCGRNVLKFKCQALSLDALAFLESNFSLAGNFVVTFEI